MIVCGLKLTHDGAVALIDNGKLVFSVEMEKRKNNPRYLRIENLSTVSEILGEFGYKMEDVDQFVIDGWEGVETSSIEVKSGDKDIRLAVAPYQEKSIEENVLAVLKGNTFEYEGKLYPYLSYPHAAGHIAGTWCTSPFGKNNNSSFILVWDGGMLPRLYYFDVQKHAVINFGPICKFIGHTYAIFAMHFGPFATKDPLKYNLSVAGKVMAYIALGKDRQELKDGFSKIYENLNAPDKEFARKFSDEAKDFVETTQYSHEDALTSFHAFVEELLVRRLTEKMAELKGDYEKNLCFVGGCALNIKWNSAVRASGVFEQVWVPPFPNDSGAAIGAASCFMLQEFTESCFEWSVYSGPEIIRNAPAPGWKKKACTVEELGLHLHESNEPVVVLIGRAELGPRALGNRSIIASPVSEKMRDILNKVKIREKYRPVAPICLEAKAQEIFDPGCSDPFMLFDHDVRKNWVDRIPAVIHLDGTARLQTINVKDNPIIAELLSVFEKASGIPVLCNTSANLNGSGFFPDIFSATSWGKVNYVWCDGSLFEKEEKEVF